MKTKSSTLFFHHPLILLYLLTLISRLIGITKNPIYADEITWMVRGKELVYALIHRNFPYFSTAWWTDTRQVEAIGLPLSFLNGIFHIFLAGQSKFSLNLLPDILASRLPIILVVSLMPPLIYFFLSHFNKRLALISSLLYLFFPIGLGLDRWLLHDSLLTLFSFAAIAFYLLALKNKTLSLLPGIFLALAFLTKPNGVLPALTWLTLLVLKPSKFALKLLVLNFLSFFTITLLWPATWSNPLAIPEYLLRQKSLSASGLVTSFFFGPTNNPHWSYFLLIIPIRLTLLTLIGLIAGLFSLRKLDRKNLPRIVAVGVYLIVSFFLISTSPQKLGIRYSLPLLPWLLIFAGFGLSRLAKVIPSKFFNPVFVALLVLPAILYFPNYYLYYSPLVGGPEGAKRIDLVGLCQGTPKALEYLHQQKPGSVYIAGCRETANFYTSLSLTKNYLAADYAIVESAYLQQFPDALDLQFIKQKPLRAKIIEGYTITAYVYQLRPIFP